MHRPENQGKPDPNLVSVSGCDGQRTLMRVACIVVWGFYIPPEAAAEVIRDSNWNHACCHPDGSSYPWEMEGNQGLLRKCAEVLAPGTMLDEKRKPRGYLLAEQPEPEVEASQELPQGCALVPGLKPRDVDKPWQKDWTFDDRGNATRLAAYFGGGLIHVEHLGWHAWDGARWRHSEVTARYCAMQSADRITEEACHWETLASSAETFKNQTGEQADKARALKTAPTVSTSPRYSRANGASSTPMACDRWRGRVIRSPLGRLRPWRALWPSIAVGEAYLAPGRRPVQVLARSGGRRGRCLSQTVSNGREPVSGERAGRRASSAVSRGAASSISTLPVEVMGIAGRRF
jgi:hypothetical protein